MPKQIVEFDETIVQKFKKTLKNEIKFIQNWARTAIPPQNTLSLDFPSMITSLFMTGIVSGSMYSNFYAGNKLYGTSSDFDIFIEYDSKFAERFKNCCLNSTDLMGPNPSFDPAFTVQELEDANYSLHPHFVQSMKLKVGGKVNHITLNIIFVQNFFHADLVKRFDFETSCWYYDYNSDKMYISDRCLELVHKRELDYTKYMKSEIDKNVGNAIFEAHMKATLIKRLQNYLNVKKYVMSKPMAEAIHEFNSRTNGPIWEVGTI
jgi:hypothetical protein